MSWAKIASKNPSKIDDSDGKVAQYVSTMWNNVYKPVALSSPSQIIDRIKDFFVNDIAGLIGEYAVFNLDLSWCNLDMCYQQKINPKNRWYVDKKSDRGNVLINTSDLEKKFMIDPVKRAFILNRFKVCQIVMEQSYYDGVVTKYTNTIIFANNRNDIIMQPRYQIEFEFLQVDLMDLIKTDNYEDFVTLIYEMYYSADGHLNNHSMTHKDKERKFGELWEFWRKVFAPKFVFNNLETLTKY
jgi:hypothetical protein